MRYAAQILLVSATPAFAHHEVVMATSILPTLAGLALISATGLGAIIQRIRKRSKPSRARTRST